MSSRVIRTRVRSWRRCPVIDTSRKGRDRKLLTGDVPSPVNPPSACRFHTRCPKATEVCSDIEPQLEDLDSGTRAACHHLLTHDEALELGVRGWG